MHGADRPSVPVPMNAQGFYVLLTEVPRVFQPVANTYQVGEACAQGLAGAGGRAVARDLAVNATRGVLRQDRVQLREQCVCHVSNLTSKFNNAAGAIPLATSSVATDMPLRVLLTRGDGPEPKNTNFALPAIIATW